MAEAGGMAAPANIMDFARAPGGQKVLLMIGVAAVVAVMVAVWMWGQ